MPLCVPFAAPLILALAGAGPALAYDLDEIPLTRWPDELGPGPRSPEDWLDDGPTPDPLAIELITARSPLATQRGDASRGRVLVAVESNLAARLEASLGQFVEDLALDGHSVLLEAMEGGTAAELKAHLTELYEGHESLNGALLIGDLPFHEYEFSNDYGSYGYTRFPCDLALMDLDGTWTDSDGNGVFDRHDDGAGDEAPELWVGRMVVTDRMGAEDEVLEAYFERNHAYRRGEIQPNGSSLVYVDDDWAYWASEYASEIGMGFPDYTEESNQSTTRKDDYLPRLEQDYDNIAVFVHSSPGEHYFVYQGRYETMLWDEVPEGSTALFYDLFACSNSNFDDDYFGVYMGGVYALNTEFGLLALGSTKTGSMLERSYYYGPLGDYDSFGDAFVHWWERVQPYHQSQRENWYYGMIQTGDPTLRVGYPTVAVDTDAVVIDQVEASVVSAEIALSNVGFDGYEWTLELQDGALGEGSWISASATHGWVEDDSDTIVLSMDPALAGGLAPTQTLLIHAPGATNNPVALPIEILQWGPTELCISESLLQLDLDVDDDGVTIEVGNCNPGTLAWTASSDASWLSVSPASSDGSAGTEPVEVLVDASRLNEHSSATLTFVAEGASNSPVQVQVDVRLGEGIRRGRCGCATGTNPLRLAWLPALLLGAAVSTRRRR